MKMKPKIFITGATGSVGSYVLDELLEQTDFELMLLVRDPNRLHQRFENHDRIKAIQGEMENIETHQDTIDKADCMIHLATSWGGAETEAVNVDSTMKLVSLLNPNRCRQIFYFSTASILDNQKQPLPEAFTLGTEYIRSKAQCREKLLTTPLADRICFIYPTLIFGGDDIHPYTHLSKDLHTLKSKIQWIRFLKAEGCFHFIHARDVARILIDRMLQGNIQPHLILGNPKITVTEAVHEFATYFGWKINYQLSLEPWLKILVKILQHRMTEWDRFCLRQRWLHYEVVNAKTYGLPDNLMTLAHILDNTPNIL